MVSTTLGVEKPILLDNLVSNTSYPLPLHLNDFYTDFRKTSLLNMRLFDSEVEIDLVDRSFYNIKSLNELYSLGYQYNIYQQVNNLDPINYSQVLNSFRSGYDEPITDQVTNDSLLNNPVTAPNNELFYTDGGKLRGNNTLKVRASTKNAIVTFNALQKVFRHRFDENRSHVHPQTLSNTEIKYPYLSEARSGYEQLLGKNKEAFFSNTSYKQELSSYYSNINSVMNSLGNYFNDIPFLLSMRSDASRHM